MRDPTPAERLQPALLDRLTDDAPEERTVEPAGARTLTRQRLRAAVLRDLAWLMNATGTGAWDHLPDVARSVVNYGMPPTAGQTVSSIDVPVFERAVRRAIIAFEPRLLPDSLKVQSTTAWHDMDAHNVITLRISGLLWAQPVPLEILLRTSVDLETGQVDIDDLGARR